MRHVPDHHLAPRSASPGRVEQPGDEAPTIAIPCLHVTDFEWIAFALLGNVVGGCS